MLQVRDFAAFYQAVHGYSPFPWQQRLVAGLVNNEWPRTLRLPTASGKTSVIDLVVFALALQAQRPAGQRTIPLRTCFVVDRRLVVDDAFRHADKLAKALRHPGSGIVTAVADRLRLFSAPQPLHVTMLRGGLVLNDGWVDYPNQPLVLTSTVDQVGSRLLFRGYGLSPNQWPVHAGLLGNDMLFVIDEAHLSQPFIDTLSALEQFRGWARQMVNTPFRTLVMSATPVEEPTTAFSLAEADFHHPTLRARLDATKPARLIPQKLKKSGFVQTAEEFAQTVSTAALQHAIDYDADDFYPFHNRVQTARQVFDTLRQQHKAVLLTGRIRPHDRDRLLEEWLPLIRATRTEEPAETIFVVATQTVEVGADISFDALVTETAPLAALRQRGGRLDRLGRRQQEGLPSPMVIVLRGQPPKDPTKAQDKDATKDPVYGELPLKTHHWLLAQADKTGVVDFGIRSLDAVIETVKEPPPAGEIPRAPVLLPAILEQWVQTSPIPHPNPDVAPYLHGPQPLAVDVQIVWRADLEEGYEAQWQNIVALLPPRTQEALSVPLYAVLAWLRGRPPPAVSDVEGAQAAMRFRSDAPRQVLRWQGEDSAVINSSAIKPGDTLVVPAAWGGCDAFGWYPENTQPVPDIAEHCQRGRDKRVRLHPCLLQSWLSDASGLDVALPALKAYLAAWQVSENDEDTLSVRQTALLNTVQGFLDRFGMQPQRVRFAPYPGDRPAGVVLSQGVAITDEDDASVLTKPVALAVHLDGVGAWSERFGRQCGLPEMRVEDLKLAGQLHDVGKADPRFQIMLFGGDEISAITGEPRAKSGMNPVNRHAFRRVWEFSGLPKGWRHEFMSVALLNEDILKRAHDADLVRYLVGVHHGRGRPFPPAVADPNPQRTYWDYQGQHFEADSNHSLARLDSGWADLFWTLVQRYGYWGLAYLEALLRLADRARSREEVAGE